MRLALAQLLVAAAAGCSRPAVEAMADGVVGGDDAAVDLALVDATATADATAPPDAVMILDGAAVVDLRVLDLRLPDLRPPPDASAADLSVADLSVPDLSVPDLSAADLSVADLAMLVVDQVPPADLTAVDLRPVCGPVVNEVQTGSATSSLEEFVEIYNPCPVDIDLSGWHLVYRSATNGSPRNGADSSTLYMFPDGGVIPSQGYLVYGGSKFLGVKDDLLGANLADPGGGVGLRNASALLVDSVGYGTATNAFVEGAAAPAHPLSFTPGRSIGRLPNGQDNDNNVGDFVLLTGTSPRLANQ